MLEIVKFTGEIEQLQGSCPCIICGKETKDRGIFRPTPGTNTFMRDFYVYAFCDDCYAIRNLQLLTKIEDAIYISEVGYGEQNA